MVESFAKKICLIVIIILVNLCVYQWTVKQPFMGDALMHIVDDTQINSIKDVIKTFYMTKNPAYNEKHRIEVMHRPIFNEILITMQKKMLNGNFQRMRYISLLIHIVNALLMFYFIKLLTSSDNRAFFISLLFSLNPVYFYGLYEFGLSFSLWLTMFTILSFISVFKYMKSKFSYFYLGTSVFTFFLAIFTKESALTLPFALILFAICILFFEERSEQKLKRLVIKLFSNKRIVLLTLGLFAILGLYLCTRYIKLGEIFEIHAGIGTNLSIKSMLVKTIGYFLLAFNISTPIIPDYMSIHINKFYVPIAIFILLFFIVSMILIVKNIMKKNLYTIIGLFIFLILLFPVFKVSRNAPYYLDIPLIGIVIAIATLKFNNQKKIFDNKFRLYVLSLSLFLFSLIVNIYFQRITTNNFDIWLTRGEQHAKKLLQDISSTSSVQLKNNKVQLLSSFFNSEEYWFFNHAQIGSFLYANLGLNLDNIQELKDIVSNENGMLMDYYYEDIKQIGSKSNLHLRTITNVAKLNREKSYSYNNLDNINCNENELIEIKGSLKANVDSNQLKPLKIVFTRTDLSVITKEYNTYGTVLPTKKNNEFKIFSLVPKSSFQFSVELSAEQKNALNSFEISIYKIEKGEQNLNSIYKGRKQLLLNNSFEKKEEGWLDFDNKLINQAHSGKRAIMVGPGTNKISFQEINVTPGKTLLITEWAKSYRELLGKGRIQINWLNSQGKQIDAYIKVIDISDKYKFYAAIVEVPKQADKAVVYITPHDESSSIIYDDVFVYER